MSTKNARRLTGPDQARQLPPKKADGFVAGFRADNHHLENLLAQVAFSARTACNRLAWEPSSNTAFSPGRGSRNRGSRTPAKVGPRSRRSGDERSNGRRWLPKPPSQIPANCAPAGKANVGRCPLAVARSSSPAPSEGKRRSTGRPPRPARRRTGCWNKRNIARDVCGSSVLLNCGSRQARPPPIAGWGSGCFMARYHVSLAASETPIQAITPKPIQRGILAMGNGAATPEERAAGSGLDQVGQQQERRQHDCHDSKTGGVVPGLHLSHPVIGGRPQPERSCGPDWRPPRRAGTPQQSHRRKAEKRFISPETGKA